MPVALVYQLVAWPLTELVNVYSSRDEVLLARMDAPTNEYARSLLETRSERRDAVVDVLMGGHVRAPDHMPYAMEAIRADRAVSGDVT